MVADIYTPGERRANILTHGIGAALSVAGFVWLIDLSRHHPGTLISCIIYGATLILLYASSALYHSATQPRIKRRLELLDHIAIYLLIAGSYTPFALVTLRGTWGWSILAVVWTMALAGIIFKIRYWPRFRRLSVALYLGMGWTILLALKPLLQNFPRMGLVWLLAGGFFYTGGLVFYIWRSMRYSHALWHTSVLFGSACHFIAVVYYVIA
jgi:hemolysin III